MARVTVAPPNEQWPAEFQSTGVRLRESLGELALRIDHIGSTSVPGLAAKDVLDIQVTVDSLDAAKLTAPLERAGFVIVSHISFDHRPPGAHGPSSDWDKFFVQPVSGRATNVHVRVAGRPNQRFALLCRDYLRTHPEAVEAYALFKLRLAAVGVDIEVYVDIKDPVFDLIVQAAEVWATSVGWQPGPSDA